MLDPPRPEQRDINSYCIVIVTVLFGFATVEQSNFENYLSNVFRPLCLLLEFTHLFIESVFRKPTTSSVCILSKYLHPTNCL